MAQSSESSSWRARSVPSASSVAVKVRSQYQPAPSSPEPPRFRSPKKRSSFLGKGLLWGSLLSMTATVSAIAGVGLGVLSPVGSWLERAVNPMVAPETATAESPDLFPFQIARPVNILVMGIDREEPNAERPSPNGLGSRSDTLLLVRFDPQAGQMKVLSIPRDTRVLIPDVGYTKINDANVYGGPQLVAEVINENLGEIAIDRYVRVTTDAFQELVDLVDGVEVFVPQPMVYEDKTQKLKIDLPAGLQTLNGEQAEQFVRFRYDANGDIGRVQRQEMLLKALQKRLTHPSMLTRIPQAIGLIQQAVDTNLSMEEILALANFSRQLERQDLHMVMVPGRFSSLEEFDGRSYWIMANGATQQILHQYFAAPLPDTEWAQRRSPETLRIALQNASEDPQALEKVRTYLRERDFRNVYTINDFPQLLEATEIVVQQGDLSAAQYLQNALGGGQVEASSTGDLGSDLTLRIGVDVAQWLKTLPVAGESQALPQPQGL